MEPCTFAEIETDFDRTVAEVAAAQRIDPICSTSHWMVPVASAFSARSTPRVFSGSAGHLALLEHTTPNGLVLSGFDAVWGFSTPLIGRDPIEAVSGLARLLPTLDYHALSLSGIDPASPLFVELQGLGPAGFTDTADRCIADLGTGFDAWIERRSPRFRRSLRAAASRGERQGVEIEHHTPALGVEVTEALERILAIEKTSWKTDANSGLVDTNLGWFTQAMARRFAAIGALRIQFAVLSGVDIGYVIGARIADRYRGFQHSFDKAYPELSIGKLLQYHAIAALAAEGVTTYDMGMHMTYKESYSDRIESTITLVFTKGGG